MTVFLGTLWSAIKEIKAPFVFGVEHRIALHAVQGNRASFCGGEEISWFYSSCSTNLGYILELQCEWIFKTPVSSVMSGLLSCCEGHLGIHHEAWQGNRDTSPGEVGDPVSLSICHRDIRFPISNQEESGKSPFEALTSVCLLSCQRNVRPPVEMRQGARAFSRVSTGDSDIPSSWEMQDEPDFKLLQGNPALFQVRASRCPFHLRPQTQGPSHILIAERSLLLRCLRKVGIPLVLKPGNQLSSRVDLECTELFRVDAVTSGSL